MTIQEELMREIIELLRGFTVVVSVMLACIFLLIAITTFYILVNERKKNIKNSVPNRTTDFPKQKEKEQINGEKK